MLADDFLVEARMSKDYFISEFLSFFLFLKNLYWKFKNYIPI